MPRVKRGFKARRRRNKVLKAAKGYRGGLGKQFTTAKIAIARAGNYAYRDRKVRKREFRSLWIMRINAAAREHGMSYSKLMGGLNAAGVVLDRKMLAELAISEPEAFSRIVGMVQ
jgi:large subunit ribosomal protein L20